MADTSKKRILIVEDERPLAHALDVKMMPVLDGFQVLQRLQQESNPPVVIVLSNLSRREDEQRVLEAGAHKYFIKSNTPLAAIVDEVKSL